GVGLIPAGGGCKEMAMRAALKAKGLDLMAVIRPYFEQIAMATVASSAPDAQTKGYLQAHDGWVMHRDEVLFAALATVKCMQASNYKPPLSTRFAVAGREGHAQLQAGLVNWLEGGFISEYDYYLANQLAGVLCGGNVNSGEHVDEQWMLRLEKEAFMALATNPLTQARIAHLLTTGKPLRN
ncbi:MAG TPA: 3-hydroxyacyl-CoA dehydrogenase, partial [Legionella sp.]|nr:3-hydroxyacyl-CoA dehydrogenase [Legionella sp.]